MLPEKDFIFLFVLLWLASAILAFLQGLLRNLHTYQWLAASLLFGPLALIASLFLHGRGRDVSVFSRGRNSAEAAQPRKIVGDLFTGKPLLNDEVRRLKRQGEYPRRRRAASHAGRGSRKEGK